MDTATGNQGQHEEEFALDGIYTRKPMVALITGITGQDGSYLAELLLAKAR